MDTNAINATANTAAVAIINTTVEKFHDDMMGCYLDTYGTEEFRDYVFEIDITVYRFATSKRNRDFLLGYLLEECTARDIVADSLDRLIPTIKDDAAVSQLLTMRAIATMYGTNDTEDIASDISAALQLDDTNSLAIILDSYGRVYDGRFDAALEPISDGVTDTWEAFGLNRADIEGC